MAEEVIKNEELLEEEMINPNDIIFEEEDDADMPTPETANYNEPNKQTELDKKTLKPKLQFMKLFEECLGKLPYASVLKNNNGDSIKLTDLVHFVEAKQNGMTVAEMNTIIGFIANCPMEHVRPLMEIIEDSKRQAELWTVE